MSTSLDPPYSWRKVRKHNHRIYIVLNSNPSQPFTVHSPVKTLPLNFDSTRVNDKISFPSTLTVTCNFKNQIINRTRQTPPIVLNRFAPNIILLLYIIPNDERSNFNKSLSELQLANRTKHSVLALKTDISLSITGGQLLQSRSKEGFLLDMAKRTRFKAFQNP